MSNGKKIVTKFFMSRRHPNVTKAHLRRDFIAINEVIDPGAMSRGD